MFLFSSDLTWPVQTSLNEGGTPVIVLVLSKEGKYKLQIQSSKHLRRARHISEVLSGLCCIFPISQEQDFQILFVCCHVLFCLPLVQFLHSTLQFLANSSWGITFLVQTYYHFVPVKQFGNFCKFNLTNKNVLLRQAASNKRAKDRI